MQELYKLSVSLTFAVLLIPSWSLTLWVSPSEEHPAFPSVPCLLLVPDKAYCWVYFPHLALNPPFLLLSFFQWNSTTSFSCKTLCGLSHLACPLLSVWECTADETPASPQLLPKFQTFTHFCLLLPFRTIFQQIKFIRSYSFWIIGLFYHAHKKADNGQTEDASELQTSIPSLFSCLFLLSFPYGLACLFYTSKVSSFGWEPLLFFPII